jgi:hypothetical protein
LISAGRNAVLGDPVVRKGILASLVATVLFMVLLNPLFKLVWLLMTRSSFGALRWFSDQVYLTAALGETNSVSLVFLFLLTGFSLGLPAGVIGYTLERRRQQKAGAIPAPHSRKARALVGLIGLCVFAVVLVNFSVLEFARTQLNTSFRQRRAVIGPYISEHDDKELGAMWASMRTRTDYDKVNAKLQEYAAKYSVKLPPPLL